MVSLKVDIKKKDLWLISAIFVFLVGVGVVIAWDSGNPVVMGHTANELAPPAGCTSGHSLIWDGASWDCGLGAAGEDRVVIGSFGSWNDPDSISGNPSSLSFGLTYTALTDLIVTAACSTPSQLHGWTPVDQLRVFHIEGQGAPGITMPVKKDDTFKVVSTVGSCTVSSYNWVPIVSGSSGSASDPTSMTVNLNTNYQVSTTKDAYLYLTTSTSSPAHASFQVKLNSFSPPTSIVAFSDMDFNARSTETIYVPKGWYFRVEESQDASRGIPVIVANYVTV